MLTTTVQKKGQIKMRAYQNAPVSEFYETISRQLRQIRTGTKEHYLSIFNSAQLPHFIRLCNYFMLYNHIAVFARDKIINRSCSVPHELMRLRRETDPEDDTTTMTTLGYNSLQRDVFGIQEVVPLHIVAVTGQIQDTFETHIPHWASENEAKEILGVSLALKLTPKHRVRVFIRNGHIIVFTTKGLTDAYGTDFIFYRKLYACIPLLANWMDAEDPTKCKYEAVYTLLRSLENNDATNFWNLYETLCNTIPEIKDMRYRGIIEAFNSINSSRKQAFITQSNNYAEELEHLMNNYSTILVNKEACDRAIAALDDEVTMDTDVIKMLADKRICYNLDTSRLNSINDSRLSFRCSTPVLGFDKSAAQAYYRRRIDNVYSSVFCKLYRLLFIDEKVILNFDEEIVVNFSRKTIQAKNGYLFHGNDYHSVLPNPHHAYHNCWGNYQPTILKLIADFKLEELFYQIKAAISSINFSDPPVISAFIRDLSNIVEGEYDPHVFLWPDENCTTLHNLQETLDHFKEEE